jgi:AAA family ATP:ADP antiporter
MRVTEHLWRILPAVRRHERTRALFFTGLLTLVTAAQTVGLAGSEAIFLAELSAQALPLAFVIASLVTVFGSVLYAARVGAARNDTLFVQMLVGAGLALIAVPLTTSRPDTPILFGLLAAFYLTQSVFTNHFWTFSGDFFDTLSSKRLFPVFTVGSSVGGLLGGIGGAFTAHWFGPLATIGLWGALLCVAALALWLARHSLIRWGPLWVDEADETSFESMRGAVGYLRRSVFGRWLVLSSIGMVFALFIAQYIYSDLFVQAHPDPADLAIFISIYLAVTNLVEIALELWVTPWLIRRFGVASSHVVHPVLTLLGFGALFASPILATAIVARVNRELVENAIAQPVPREGSVIRPRRHWSEIARRHGLIDPDMKRRLHLREGGGKKQNEGKRRPQASQLSSWRSCYHDLNGFGQPALFRRPISNTPCESHNLPKGGRFWSSPRREREDWPKERLNPRAECAQDAAVTTPKPHAESASFHPRRGDRD